MLVVTDEGAFVLLSVNAVVRIDVAIARPLVCRFMIGQLEPAGSLLRVLVPRQHPCGDDKHNAAAVGPGLV